MMYPFVSRACLTVVAVFLSASTSWAAPQFVGLGDLRGGDYYSMAHGVSADGSTVVGKSRSSKGEMPFRWTRASGMVDLGRLPGSDVDYGQATAVSADGSVVVGRSAATTGTRDEAFRWTAETGMVALGDLPGLNFNSFAQGVSADGSIVVGESTSTRGDEAFRWTEATGMVGLGDLPDNFFRSRANGITPDGSTIVGFTTPLGGPEASLITGSSVNLLGKLPGGTYSEALAVSANGSVAVGRGNSSRSDIWEAFRWSESTGIVGLGDFDDGFSYSGAYAVSADGSIVVGHATTAAGHTAFVWDDEHGMRSLQEVLSNEFGLAESLAGWQLHIATGISADGRVIVGYGESPQSLGEYEAWLVDLGADDALVGDTNGDGVVDLEDLNNVRNTFGETGAGLAGDANGDGTVDLTDLNAVRNNFGASNPVPVPEPGTFGLLVAAGLGGVWLRRVFPC
jgi:probable HAF family extracellular repeat protein